MKIALIVLLALVVLLGCIGFIGWLLPPTRAATAQRDIAAPPGKVWGVLTDLHRQSEWRPDLAAIEVMDPTVGKERWREKPKHGPAMEFQTTSQVAGVSWEMKFSGSVEGRWSGRLKELPEGGTRIEVEETVTVANPWKRLLARLFFDPQAIAEEYLANLARAVEISVQSD
jgi:uncharacterized protein YndB with AHSA1/START domain